MNVKLLSATYDALDVIYTAIRTCKSADTPETIYENAVVMDVPAKLRLIKACHKAGHDSVLEHMGMTFSVEGVSRALLAQYTRHRHISFSVQSQRYVVEKGMFDYVKPPSIQDGTVSGKLYDLEQNEYTLEEAYENWMIYAQRYYDLLKNSGIPTEDARFVLPNAACTNFVTSMNLRSFLELYEKRVKVKGAQWEIRNMVELMTEKLIEKSPWVKELLEV